MPSTDTVSQRIVDEVIKQLIDLQPDTEARVKAEIQGIIEEWMQPAQMS